MIPAGPEHRHRPKWVGLLVAALVVFGVAGLLGLGIWQLERRLEKLALIDRVETRIHATPSPAPGPADWSGITAAEDEYRRVRLSGRFLNDRETLVQAVTELGAGFWVLTPLVSDAGVTVLVNRGYVPPENRDRETRAQGDLSGQVTITGLLRMSEPHGGFLRSNDPAANRWYSRDVKAIATARGLTDIAPFFVDADATPNPGGLPIGGLTVVQFPDNHLVYALTWFSMALGLAAGALWARWRKR